MKILILVLCLFLAACHHNPIAVPVPQVDCSKDLDVSYLQACSKPAELKQGAVFSDSLELNAEQKKALADCSIKTKVLQDTIKACKRATK